MNEVLKSTLIVFYQKSESNLPKSEKIHKFNHFLDKIYKSLQKKILDARKAVLTTPSQEISMEEEKVLLKSWKN